MTSGEVHLHGLAPGQHSAEETSQRWRDVGDCADLTGLEIKPMTSQTVSGACNHDPNILYLFNNICLYFDRAAGNCLFVVGSTTVRRRQVVSMSDSTLGDRPYPDPPPTPSTGKSFLVHQFIMTHIDLFS